MAVRRDSKLQIHKIQRYIQFNYAKSYISEGRAAQRFEVHPNHLEQFITRHFDSTFMRLIWKERLKHIRELLRTTELNMDQIAGRTGFTNGRNMSDKFKRATGGPPMAYRREKIRRRGRPVKEVV